MAYTGSQAHRSSYESSRTGADTSPNSYGDTAAHESWQYSEGGSKNAITTTTDVSARNKPIIDHIDDWFGARLNLEPCLRRRHIMMISIGGTIGTGLLVSSSKILHLSGSTGVIVAYSMVGMVVAAVMSCVAEMVSLVPEPGALALFPGRYIDPSLGVAVGISYWFTNAMAATTLTTSTTVLTTYWSRDVLDLDTGWRITIFLLILIAINVFGVKVYGEVEHFFGWLKILMVLGLTIMSLAISCGANKDHKYFGTTYWRNEFKIPPFYEGHPELTGTTGRFLAIWDSFTSAAFAYIGVEIVAMTAGEAKYPRRDIPFAAKFVWLITISLYVFSVMFVSLCVPWTNTKLLKLSDPRARNTGAASPFIIALSEAGYAVVPSLTNAGYVFAAWTAANTGLYVASRTLYGMCQGMTKERNRFLWPLGRTRVSNGAPVPAIVASCVFTPLAYILCATQDHQKLIEIFSRMGTTSCLLVWGCQCLAFLRFYFGLKYSIYDRRAGAPKYPYKSVWQPYTAIFGLVSCTLILIFNGWSVFYVKPFKVDKLIAAYLWPVIFFLIYITHKLVTKSEMRPLDSLEYHTQFGDKDELVPPSKGPILNLFEFEKPRRRDKKLDGGVGEMGIRV
ncbi:MAG: hypothetical protein M1814_003061 [Vezdaea aestivalis]|nr:MAG: hypothetical protein M1814_003061 [Vezdaea aestivalis]